MKSLPTGDFLEKKTKQKFVLTFEQKNPIKFGSLLLGLRLINLSEDVVNLCMSIY